MTLEQYLEYEKNRLGAFAVWYSDNKKLSPSKFPNDLQLGDWDEQLMMFEPCDCQMGETCDTCNPNL